MRAAVLSGGRVVIRDDVAEPVPEAGQVLVQVEACGICGSDLHFARHGRTMLDLGQRMKGMPSLGVQSRIDLDRDVYLGHEFAATVLRAGPGTEAPPPGTVVTSMPVLVGSGGIEPIVYSNDVVGGYSERMLLSAPLLLEVPAGTDPRHAALTEPMAVGLHAVNRSGITDQDKGPGTAPRPGALVIGCGPVGLAVIAALELEGVEPIVGSDPSPARRARAARMGAHQVVDPAREDPFDVWAGLGRDLPPVVFDAVGVPGIIDSVMERAPRRAILVVVGVCMELDTLTPFFGISKELDVRFSLGYEPAEFARCLQEIASGRIDVAQMVTGEVRLDGVPQAFEELGHPERACKILVVPGR